MTNPEVKYKILNEDADALRRIQRTIHESCVEAGWYSDLETGKPIERNTGEVLMLMVTELAEAMEGHRKNLMDSHLPHRKNMEVELADCVIRILDTAHSLGMDVAGAMQEKFEYNQVRADHKIENRRGVGGKKV